MTVTIDRLIKLVAILLLVLIFTACGAETPYVLEQTITPTTSRLPIQINTSTSGPTATLSPIENYMHKTGVLSGKCQEAFVKNIETLSPDGKSPDRNWTIYDCPETFELFIINHDGSKAWHLGHDQLTSSTDIPDSISIQHWSSDSQYVYFVPEYAISCCWDSGIVSIDTMFTELWQFDVKTGKYTNLFLNVASYDSDNYPSMSGISFSPTDKIMLITPQRKIAPPIVYIYDLEKNKVNDRLTLPDSPKSTVSGNVVWSPDGQRFAMTSASGGDYEY